MARPTDWQVLNLGGDPLPGNPECVRELSRLARRTADDASEAERGLRSLAGDQAVLAWAGAAADAFRPSIQQLPEKLGRVATSYSTAAGALDYWATALDGAQGDADRALAKGRTAGGALDRVSGELTLAEAADTAARRALAASCACGGPDPAQQRAVAETTHRVEVLRRQIDQAREGIEQARRCADDAGRRRDDAAVRVVKQLRDACDVVPPRDNGWERIKDAVSKVWNGTVKAAKVVNVVASTLSVIVPHPIAKAVLGGVTMATGAIGTIDTVIRWKQGKATAGQVAMSALDMIPGVGLGARGAQAVGAGLRSPKVSRFLGAANVAIRESIRRLRKPAEWVVRRVVSLIQPRPFPGLPTGPIRLPISVPITIPITVPFGRRPGSEPAEPVRIPHPKRRLA